LTQLILLCVCSCTKHKTPNTSHSWLTLLSLLCLACIRVRPLTHWLVLRTHNIGQRGGGQRRLLCLAHFAQLALLSSLCLACILLAEVPMLLGTSFLGDSGRRLSTRSLVSFLTLVGSFLIGLYIGLFLGTYVLYNLQRGMRSKRIPTGVITFSLR
jgi:hypothetical protein